MILPKGRKKKEEKITGNTFRKEKKERKKTIGNRTLTSE